MIIIYEGRRAFGVLARRLDQWLLISGFVSKWIEDGGDPGMVRVHATSVFFVP